MLANRKRYAAVYMWHRERLRNKGTPCRAPERLSPVAKREHVGDTSRECNVELHNSGTLHGYSNGKARRSGRAR